MYNTLIIANKDLLFQHNHKRNLCERSERPDNSYIGQVLTDEFCQVLILIPFIVIKTS